MLGGGVGGGWGFGGRGGKGGVAREPPLVFFLWVKRILRRTEIKRLGKNPPACEAGAKQTTEILSQIFCFASEQAGGFLPAGCRHCFLSKQEQRKKRGCNATKQKNL